MKENLGGSGSKKPPLAQGSGRNNGSFGSNGGWDSWDNDDGFRSSSDIRRNQSTRNVRGISGSGSDAIRGMSARSKSMKISICDHSWRLWLLIKSFFSQKMQENDSRTQRDPTVVRQQVYGVWVGPHTIPKEY